MANTILDNLKTLLQIDSTDTSQDDLLNALLNQCIDEYLDRTHQKDPDDPIVLAMAVERFNTLGNEGINSIGYSGISESYFTDYSEKVQKLIKSKTRMMSL